MGLVSQINDGINTRLGIALGNTFSQLNFVTDISLNKFQRASKRYGVMPNSASETAGTVGGTTLDHSFMITLTDSYTAKDGDSLKAERVNELMDKALDIFTDIQTYKSSLSPKVLIVNQLSIESPEYLEEEKVIILKFAINVKYRI